MYAGIVGLSSAYPQWDIQDQLNAQGKADVALASDACIIDFGTKMFFKNINNDTLVPNAIAQPPNQAIIARTTSASTFPSRRSTTTTPRATRRCRPADSQALVPSTARRASRSTPSRWSSPSTSRSPSPSPRTCSPGSATASRASRAVDLLTAPAADRPAVRRLHVPAHAGFASKPAALGVRRLAASTESHCMALVDGLDVPEISGRERRRRAEAVRRHLGDARVRALASGGELALLRAELQAATRLTMRLGQLEDVTEMAELVVEDLHTSFAYYLVAIQRLDGHVLRHVASRGELARVMSEFLLDEQSVNEGVNGRVARSAAHRARPGHAPGPRLHRARPADRPALGVQRADPLRRAPVGRAQHRGARGGRAHRGPCRPARGRRRQPRRGAAPRGPAQRAARLLHHHPRRAHQCRRDEG